MTGIAYDIIFYGLKSDSGNHDNENLRAVMKRAREIGMKFNPEKSKIRCNSILYFGHILGAEGLKRDIDLQKIESILTMDPSASITDLRTFLGMVQLLSQFISNLATMAANLWALT